MCMHSLVRNTYVLSLLQVSTCSFSSVFYQIAQFCLVSKGWYRLFFVVITSLMLVYNELVISMEVVFIFPINSVLNIPSIFVEPNRYDVSKYKNLINKTCFAKTWYGNIATEYPFRNTVIYHGFPFYVLFRQISS